MHGLFTEMHEISLIENPNKLLHALCIGVGSCFWHFAVTSLFYANRIQGRVAATSARMVKADSKSSRHRAVVQILTRLLLRCGWTTVITTLSASSSAMGRPSALMMKI